MSTKITLEDRLFTLEEVVFLMSEAVEQPEKNEYDIVDFFFLKKYKKQQEALMAKERAKNYMRLKDGYKEKMANYTAVEWLVEELSRLGHNFELYKKKIEQAEEIEKQQIVDAYEDAINKGRQQEGEQYYNKKFKNI